MKGSAPRNPTNLLIALSLVALVGTRALAQTPSAADAPKEPATTPTWNGKVNFLAMVDQPTDAAIDATPAMPALLEQIARHAADEARMAAPALAHSGPSIQRPWLEDLIVTLVSALLVWWLVSGLS